MRFTKDPDAVLDYLFDWRAKTHTGKGTDWLANGETVASFAVVVDDGITVGTGSQAPSEDDGAITVWLSGGETSRTYGVTCHIVTSAGREDDRSAQVYVTER